MNTQEFKRKLTAVFSADVAGYSRLMGEDEAATVKTLETYKQIMFSLIKQHRGRVIDSPGDNLLAEFASVVDAVQCGVAVQKELQARNAELPENRKMQFRIGINLGDVIEEQDRIYGDGVNIAARLESCADPGGICVSKTAFDHIESKLPLGYEYLGEKEVKNIAKPVGAYRVLMEPRVTVAGAKEKKPSIRPRQRKGILAAAVAVLVVIIGVAVWNFHWRAPKIEPASKDKMAYPLPDKPSIAVLPFANMSGDSKEDYFSDGITEEIITALSRIPRLFVISRQSTFTYKGKPVKVKQVSEELGVRYVLEGSVRKAGDDVRISAQLIDAITGYHLWSERYDRKLKDIFALQDEITLKIISALQVNLAGVERLGLSFKGTNNLEAYLKLLQSREQTDRWTKEGNIRARKYAEEAIALDAKYAGAYLRLSATYIMDSRYGTVESADQSLRRAEECVQKALSLDESSGEAHAFLGRIYLTKRLYEKAIAEGERALALDPNSDFVQAALAYSLHYAGRFDEAIALYQKAIRINPFPAWYYLVLASSYAQLERYEEAVKEFEKALHRSPDSTMPHVGLAAAYASMGREKEAQAEAAEVLRVDPKFSLENWAKSLHYKNQVYLDRHLDALRKAGLPNKPPLPLPDRPSIAVLPFINMSDDKSQEYFSDGLTEEIITALSKNQKLFVIARNSTFVYKGKSMNVQQVGRELGVKYILEGSVRRSGDQLRVTAQLIDATTGSHLWAERYDREMKDVFAIQDEVTMKVLLAMQVKLVEGEQAPIRAGGTRKLAAYERFLQATEYHYRFTREAGAMARQLCEEAIALDSEYAAAYSLLSVVLLAEVRYGWTKTRAETLQRAVEMAQKALSLDPESLIAQLAMGQIHLLKKDHDQAIAWGERAVGTHPNADNANAFLAWFLAFSGRPEEAIPLLKNAIRRNPMPPGWYHTILGNAYRLMGGFEEAATELRKAVDRSPDDMLAHMVLTAAYAQAGRQEEARIQAAEVMRIQPAFSLDYYERTSAYKNKADTDRYIEALRKAGLK